MRIRRHSRRPMTAKQKRGLELVYRSTLRARILARGVAQELEHVYDFVDYQRILDFMATDVTPAMKDMERTAEALESTRKDDRSAVRKPGAAANKKKGAK